MAETAIDKQYLEGLTFSGSTAKEVKEEGQAKRTVYIPFERPAKPGDVLDWKRRDDGITIVMKDGKKYSVPAKAEKKQEAPVAKISLDGNVGVAVDAISKMNDVAQIKAFVKGDERPGVVNAAEAAIAGLK